MSKVHRTKNGKILKTYRFIPYEEIAEVLNSEGEAFLEQDNSRPLKRSTMWRAAKKLSGMIGKNVTYKKAIYRVGDVYLDGYLFSVEDE